MQRTAITSHRSAAVWLGAIAVIAIWLNLKPDWAFMRESVWAWPAVEYLHVLGLVGFFGLRTTIDLRLTNRAFVAVPIATLLLRFVPVTVALAAITVVTGMALYSTTPEIMASRPMFQLKVVFLTLALLNLCFLHAVALPAAEKLEGSNVTPSTARISAVLSIILWAFVIVASLLIPYIN